MRVHCTAPPHLRADKQDDRLVALHVHSLVPSLSISFFPLRFSADVCSCCDCLPPQPHTTYTHIIAVSCAVVPCVCEGSGSGQQAVPGFWLVWIRFCLLPCLPGRMVWFGSRTLFYRSACVCGFTSRSLPSPAHNGFVGAATLSHHLHNAALLRKHAIAVRHLASPPHPRFAKIPSGLFARSRCWRNR